MIEITYQPYVGMLLTGKHVHTKMHKDGKLHFVQMDESKEVFYDEFVKSNIDDLIQDKVEGFKYIGWLKLNPPTKDQE